MNCVTKETTQASGLDTFGEVNQHPSDDLLPPTTLGSHLQGGNEAEGGVSGEYENSEAGEGGIGRREGRGSGFRVGVSVDRNKKCRRTMEE